MSANMPNQLCLNHNQQNQPRVQLYQFQAY